MAVDVLEDVVQETVLRRDIAEAVETLQPAEARWLVDMYYTIQRDRIRAGNRVAAMSRSGEPHRLIAYFAGRHEELEREIRSVLSKYVKHLATTRPDVRWLLGVRGIGPVLACGLLSEIDITKATTASKVWRFAGLDPTVQWKPGQKRPWNARLKTLCWKVGESFKKQPPDRSFYSALYRQRKELEVQRNEAGAYAELAARTLHDRPNHSQREYYAARKLPPGRLDMRAMRWAVKIFLAHLHYVMYETHYGSPPPRPYALEHLGHADYIPVPDWPV